MTREKVESAEALIRDIDILEVIRDAQNKSYWIKFLTPLTGEEQLEFGSDTFLDDFKKFVADEIDKLEEELRLL